MNSGVVKMLYRTKLRECIRMGYKPGEWSSKVVTEKKALSKRKIKKLNRKGALGHYIFNNVRYHYKKDMNSSYENEEDLNNKICSGFSHLRDINELSHKVEYDLLGML
jgi:hypothetical protein